MQPSRRCCVTDLVRLLVGEAAVRSVLLRDDLAAAGGAFDPFGPVGLHMMDRSLLARFTAEAGIDGVQQLVVGAVVQHAGNVLLIQRPDDDFMGGIFELPSGKVEESEPLDVALIREVKEETGLDVAAIRDYLGSFDYTSGSGKKSRQFNFAVHVNTPEPITLHEHDAYTWTTLTEEPPVTDAVKEVLARYRELRGM